MRIAEVDNNIAVYMTAKEINNVCKEMELKTKEELCSVIMLTILFISGQGSTPIIAGGMSTISEQNGMTFLISIGNEEMIDAETFEWENIQYDTIPPETFFLIPKETLHEMLENVHTTTNEEEFFAHLNGEYDDEDEDDEMEDDEPLPLFVSNLPKVVFVEKKLSDIKVYQCLAPTGIYEYKNQYYVVVPNSYRLADFEHISSVTEEELKRFGKKIVKKKNLSQFFSVL